MLEQAGLVTAASIIRFFATVESVPGHGLVKSATLKTSQGACMDVFYKEYVYLQPTLRFVARASKARREFTNYQAFETMGIACAERIAWGEQRDRLGRLCHAFIITRAIPRALTLIEFIRQHCPQRNTAAATNLRNGLLHQLAGMVRRSHHESFFHNDLYWRNVLVTWALPVEPKLWWIDCPRGRFDSWSPLQYHRRVKDLACLGKIAITSCTHRERLDFIRHYLGISRLDAPAKRLIRSIQAHRFLK